MVYQGVTVVSSGILRRHVATMYIAVYRGCGTKLEDKLRLFL